MKTKKEIIKEATGYTSKQIAVSEKYGQPFYSFNELEECMEVYHSQFTLSREELVDKIKAALESINPKLNMSREDMFGIVADALMGYVPTITNADDLNEITDKLSAEIYQACNVYLEGFTAELERGKLSADVPVDEKTRVRCTPFEELINEYHIWASKTFQNSTWQSSLDGLRRELKEVENESAGSSQQAQEYVDCFMYLLDSMRRAGVSQSQFKAAFEEKLAINKVRDWKQNDDKTYSHIKER